VGEYQRPAARILYVPGGASEDFAGATNFRPVACSTGFSGTLDRPKAAANPPAAPEKPAPGPDNPRRRSTPAESRQIVPRWADDLVFEAGARGAGRRKRPVFLNFDERGSYVGLWKYPPSIPEPGRALKVLSHDTVFGRADSTDKIGRRPPPAPGTKGPRPDHDS